MRRVSTQQTSPWDEQQQVEGSWAAELERGHRAADGWDGRVVEAGMEGTMVKGWCREGLLWIGGLGWCKVAKTYSCLVSLPGDDQGLLQNNAYQKGSGSN